MQQKNLNNEDQNTQQKPAAKNQNQINFDILKLLPAQQISQKVYSLQPDMVNGWKPKNKKSFMQFSVFPIRYDHYKIDQVTTFLLNTRIKEYKKYKIIYLGERPNNSYLLHQNIKKSNLQYKNPYTNNNQILSKLNQRGFCGMNPKIVYNQQTLIFDSTFQSGNLDLVIKVNQNQYDLFMRVDTNTHGHTNWFNFIIKNKNKSGPIKFNICNFQKQKSLYQRGMKPYIYSKQTFQHQGYSWRQAGNNITYTRQKWRYDQLFDEEENEDKWYSTFVLSFTYQFLYQNDQTQFAYCIPYTYTNLLTLLNFLQKFEFVKISYSWKSLSCIDIPILTITGIILIHTVDQFSREFEKKIIFISCRVHPGESNSSIMLQGFLKYLCNDNQDSRQLRKKTIFIVIPMINPDGVIAGNYRTSLFGKDLNRTFNESRKHLYPESINLKQFLFQQKKNYQDNFDMFIDLHGHSTKKNVFIYGPEYTITQNRYYQCRLLPKIFSSITSMFRYYSCIFRISLSKDSTARAIFNRSLAITNCYTIQASNGFYYDKNNHIQYQFNKQTWQKMGVSICKGIHDYVNIMISKNRPITIKQNLKHIDKIVIKEKLNHSQKKSSTNKTDYDEFVKEKSKNSQRKRYESFEGVSTEPDIPERFDQIPQQDDKKSDDYISEGQSDSQSQKQDLKPEQLLQLQKQLSPSIKKKNRKHLQQKQHFRIKSRSIQKQKQKQKQMEYHKSKQLSKQKPREKRPQEIQSLLIINKKIKQKKKIQEKLPPLPLYFQKPNLISKQTKKKDFSTYQRLMNIQSTQSNCSTTFIKSPNISQNVANSIGNMILNFNDPIFRLNDSLSLVKRQIYDASNIKSFSMTRENKSGISIQSKFDKIVRNLHY